MTCNLDKAKIDLELILKPFKLGYPYFMVYFYRKSDLEPIKVISIISMPDMNSILKSEQFISADYEINHYEWHDFYLLINNGLNWETNEKLDDLMWSLYEIDGEMNYKPLFKSFFDKLKTEWRKAQKGI